MNNFRIEAASEKDIDWIFELAIKNNRKNVTDRSQGFIQGSAESADAYKAWVQRGSLFVMKDGDRGVGFLSLQKENVKMGKGPAILQYIFSHEDTLSFEGKKLSETKWTMYGPVLIAAEYRGKGLARKFMDFNPAKGFQINC